MLLMAAATTVLATSCENDNINPYDYVNNNGGNENQGSKDVVKTAVAEYPVGSLVWTKDTTISESVEIPVGTSLYIEPGVTVTCKSEVKVPVEIVVLGNLYCMGTAEKPVTFTSDTKKPEDWGGIICGFNCEEVVLNHVDISCAGATPTESSASWQNKLFKTDKIDGGVPAFHFCNVKGKFVMANCFFHDNYNDQTYFTGGNGVIINNIFADSGNAADGGEAINVKSGCKLDVANNIIYNACTNAFKLSNAGNSEVIPLTEMTVYNNTIVDCGWRRAKNKKGGSVWVEKAAKPVFVNNLVYDSRFCLKQPKQDGADMEHSRLTPNYYFASTETGVSQIAKGASLGIWFDTDIKSSVAGQFNPLFASFKQSDKMNVNCEVDDVENGAPLAFDRSWNFHFLEGSPALSGGVTDFVRLFPNGLPFFGMKKVNFLNIQDDQNYYFSAPLPSARFGAWL